MNCTLRTKDLQREAFAGAVDRLVRPKRRRHAVAEAVRRWDSVAAAWAHTLTALTRVARLRFLAVLPNSRKTPTRVAREETHEIENVRAKHHQVLSAAA